PGLPAHRRQAAGHRRARGLLDGDRARDRYPGGGHRGGPPGPAGGRRRQRPGPLRSLRAAFLARHHAHPVVRGPSRLAAGVGLYRAVGRSATQSGDDRLAVVRAPHRRRRRHDASHARRDGRDARRRLRANGTREERDRADGGAQARPAQRADPGRHPGCDRVRTATVRRRADRADLRDSRIRQDAGRRRVQSRLRRRPGCRPRLGHAVRAAQPGRRRAGVSRQPATSRPGVSTASTTLAVTVARRPSALGRLLRRAAAGLSAAEVSVFWIIAAAAPWLAPFDPIATDFAAVRKAPSALHRLGTDEVGRDVLSRLIWGARASLLAGLIPLTMALVVSIPLGLVSGYAGGWTDDLIMRLTDAMLAIPFLIVAIALAAFLGPSLSNAMIAIGIAALPVFLRLARNTVLTVKAEEYVEAARALGGSPFRIGARAILPNMLPPLVIQSSLPAAASITPAPPPP